MRRMPVVLTAGITAAFLTCIGTAHAASASNDTLSIQLMILGLCITPAIYFLPSIFAATRDHPAANGVFAVNLFLGWTVVGWAVAMVWVFMAQNRIVDRPKGVSVSRADEPRDHLSSVTSMLAIVDVAAQEIEDLTRQRLQMLISEDEYDQRKKVILDRWKAVPLPAVTIDT